MEFKARVSLNEDVKKKRNEVVAKEDEYRAALAVFHDQENLYKSACKMASIGATETEIRSPAEQ